MPRAKDCKISKLIITHYHEKCLHQGRGVTVNTIRSNGFWILGLVSSVALVIYKCITCRKLYRHTVEQQMALLPSDRVEESPPFTFFGCGYIWSVFIKKMVEMYIISTVITRV